MKPEATRPLELTLTPSGKLLLEQADGGAPVEAAASARIEKAFARGEGHGVFHLGAGELRTALPPSLSFFRELGRLFVSRLCALPDLESLRDKALPQPPEGALSSMVEQVPAMKGAEYLTASVLERLWAEAHEAFGVELGESSERAGSVEAFLRAKSPVWNALGRVHFHLAENKRDPDRPFAFLATYASGLTDGGKPRHLPLGKALTEYGSARDKAALLSLLLPVQRAAEKSELLRGMVERGEIYHPLAWGPGEAYRFLMEVDLYEQAGVMVRVPDWWHAQRPPRPQVRAKIGKGPPRGVGLDALIDFDVDVALDGEKLTEAELRSLLAGDEGLVLLKGRWVEVDKKKLEGMLASWKDLQQKARREGLRFLDALRLAARAGGPGALEVSEGEGWARVEPGEWLARTLEELRAPGAAPAVGPIEGLSAKLRPYQEVGVRWLDLTTRLQLGACLADDMGLGKTLQVIALLLLRKHRGEKGQSLLVVPASLLANWKAEASRFAPELRLLVLHPSAGESLSEKRGLSGYDAVVTTYGSLLRAPWLRETRFSLVVLDEAQAIKNPDAKQTRAAKEIKAPARLALTGTPVENRLTDLWSLFDFLSPGLLGTPREFRSLEKRVSTGEPGAYAPLRALVKPYILRRLKTDPAVAPDLPERTEVKTFCSLSRKQAALYEQAVKDLKKALDDSESEIARRGAVLASLMRFKQICNHPSQWLGSGDYEVKQSGKLERLVSLAEEIAERQQKALVFTQFREVTRPLALVLERAFGRPGLVLDGRTPVKKRKELVDQFQAEGGPPFFVISLKAGGTGLTLTAASHVIHFDRWWNPAVEDQATDRAHRIGQKQPVLVHKLICRGTVEERIDDMISSKKSMARELLEGSAEARLTEMSDEELMALVKLDIRSALGEE